MWLIHPIYSNYYVSACGRVRHKLKDKDRATRVDKYGYERINLCHNKKTITVKVHTMVAECFILNSNSLSTINHKDGNKRNNAASNLEWMSAADNTSDAYSRAHKRCTPVYVLGIRYRSIREAARECGLKRSNWKSWSDMPHFQLKKD